MARRDRGDENTVQLHRHYERSRMVNQGHEITKTLTERLGPEYPQFLERVRAGTHDPAEFYAYHRKLAHQFIKGYVKSQMQRGTGHLVPAAYSEDAANAIEVIVSDFRDALEHGQTFERAVSNLGNLTGNRDLPSTLPLKMRYGLRKALRGNNRDFGASFPMMLTYLWELKMYRPRAYATALHVGKWVRLVAAATKAYIRKEEKQYLEAREFADVREKTPEDIKKEKLFEEARGIDEEKAPLAGFIQDYGMLHPEVPLVEDSGRVLSDSELLSLKKHGQLGYEMLKKTGMPESDYLEWIVSYHNEPFNLLSGIAAVADKFEGTFFFRPKRDKLLTPRKVFEIMKQDMFNEEQVKALDRISQFGYRHDAPELEGNPFVIPFQMMRLLFGILE